MEYRIITKIGNSRAVIAEVASRPWAETFAEVVRKWNGEMGGFEIAEIIIEEITEN